MKVLLADAFEQTGLDGLAAAGCEVVYRPGMKDAALVDALRETAADILVVRSTKVTSAMLDAGRLSLVVRAGAGVNTIDVAAAAARGIYVANCPGKNAIAVAELTFALMLALDRRIPDGAAALRAGQWNKTEFSKARGLYGRTIGLLGFGPIGVEVARRAIAFGMPVVIWTRRFANEDRALTIADLAREGVSLDLAGARVHLAPTPVETAARSDILSIHLAMSPATRGIVNADVLNALAPGSYVINTARGELLDQAALDAAIREKGLRAGLDVFAQEPAGGAGAFDDPIVHAANVYGSHHIGASTDQAQDAIAAETVRIIRTFMKTGKPANVVNLCTRTPATHMLVVRHLDRPGVLAHVFENLRAGSLNVQETENIVFDGAKAAVARINLDGEPSASTLATIREGSTDILDLHVVALAGAPHR